MFLPKTIISLLAKSNEDIPFILEKGTVVFCDVAGFTPLTEALSGMGREGAEKLTEILNGYFTEMIKIVDNAGGDVIRFGGDAMTLFFHEGLEYNAAIASHLMMNKMEAFSDIRAGGMQFSLAMKIGIAYGSVIFGVIGEPDKSMDYYAAGAPLDNSAEAEHKASKGMIVFHPTFRQTYLGETRELDDGFAESTAPGVDLKMPMPVRRSELILPDRKMSMLVPGYLVEKAGKGTLGEHRGTAVIFMGVEGLSPGYDERSAEKFHSDLNSLFLHMASSVNNYGGTINKVDMGDKGIKAIILFGSPRALENKEEMAVRCAMEIRDKNTLKGLASLKAGITSSALFTGPVGSPDRREFTVMGDGINTAARLMQKAGFNEIYCDERTAELTRSSVTFRALEPLTLKGKEKPVPVFIPEGFAGRGGRFELPVIIEREESLEKIKCLLLRRSRPLLVTGEAGTGKTVLIEWARRESLSLGVATTRIFLAPYHRTRSYSFWKGALRSLIGASKEDPPEKVRGMRDAMLDKESRAYGALLDPILGLEGGSDGSFGSLNPRERKELTFAVAEKLILSGGERVILADNLEWTDPLSLELLNFLFQGGTDIPIKFVASCRSVSADLEKIAGHFECLSIPPFSERGTDDHLRLNLKLDSVSASLREWFLSKTGGNPKLIGAIFQILKEKDIISLDDGRYLVDEDRLFSTPFPERLEEIYLGKIDELPRDEREIVQAASVLGYSVSLYLLSLASGTKKEGALKISEKLIEKGIFRSDSWRERPYFRFSDDLLRDAVYNSLPFSLKRDAHLKCALFLEKESEGKPGLYPVIAGHFKGAGDPERANLYNRKSAYDALGRFDNLTAMRFLEEICGEVISRDNIECAFNLVEVYGNLGRANEEMALIARLEGLESDIESNLQLRLLSFKTKRAIMERDFQKAEGLFLVAEELASEFDDDAALAKIYVNMAGGLYGPRGELEKAQAVLEKCLSLRDTRDSVLFKVTALFNVGNILKHQGRVEDALETYRKAYQRASRLKLLPQLANISGAIANLLYAMSDHRKALEWARRTRKWADTFSLRQLILFNDYIQAVIEYTLGNCADAGNRLRNNVKNAGRLNNQYLSGISSQALIEVGQSLLDINGCLSSGLSALNTLKETRNSTIFKETMIEFLKLFYSLGQPAIAKRLIEENGFTDFIRSSPPAPNIDPLLSVLLSYADRGKFEGNDIDYSSLLEKLKSDHLFLMLEENVRKDDVREASLIADQLFKRNDVMRSVPLKVRLFLFMSVLGDERAKALGCLSVNHLMKAPFGIHGLRACAILWDFERSSRKKARWRRLFISRMYGIRSNSPEWAFKSLLSFPEIRKCFVG